jgi:hypothetical protein
MEPFCLIRRQQLLLRPGLKQSTNVLDLLNARDMGIGDSPSLEILCQVAVAFAGGTSLIAALQGSTDNVTYTTMMVSNTALTATLTVGARLLEGTIPRPVAGQALPRYLRILYTTNGTFSPGSITAAIVLDRQDYVNYPAGINIAN